MNFSNAYHRSSPLFLERVNVAVKDCLGLCGWPRVGKDQIKLYFLTLPETLSGPINAELSTGTFYNVASIERDLDSSRSLLHSWGAAICGSSK